MKPTPQHPTSHPSAYRPPPRTLDAETLLELDDGVELTADDVRALALLADAGLVPPFRHLSVA